MVNGQSRGELSRFVTPTGLPLSPDRLEALRPVHSPYFHAYLDSVSSCLGKLAVVEAAPSYGQRCIFVTP